MSVGPGGPSGVEGGAPSPKPDQAPKAPEGPLERAYADLNKPPAAGGETSAQPPAAEGSLERAYRDITSGVGTEPQASGAEGTLDSLAPATLKLSPEEVVRRDAAETARLTKATALATDLYEKGFLGNGLSAEEKLAKASALGQELYGMGFGGVEPPATSGEDALTRTYRDLDALAGAPSGLERQQARFERIGEIKDMLRAFDIEVAGDPAKLDRAMAVGEGLYRQGSERQQARLAEIDGIKDSLKALDVKETSGFEVDRAQRDIVRAYLDIVTAAKDTGAFDDLMNQFRAANVKQEYGKIGKLDNRTIKDIARDILAKLGIELPSAEAGTLDDVAAAEYSRPIIEQQAKAHTIAGDVPSEGLSIITAEPTRVEMPTETPTPTPTPGAASGSV